MLAAAPLLPILLAFAAGLAARSALPATATSLIVAGAVLLASAAGALLARRERLAAALFLAAVATMGVLRGASHPPPPGHLATMELPPTVTVEGVLAEEPVRWAPDRIRLALD